MKNIIIILSLLTISFNGLSQNKKEQIMQLNNRIDSCQNVIADQSAQIKSLSTENKIINDKLAKTESDLRIKENLLNETQDQLAVKNIENNMLKVQLDSIYNIKKQNPINFLPKGFVVFERINGDLNKDGIEDCVLIIKGTSEDQIIMDEYLGKLDRNRRGIIVLFNKSDHYELAMKNYNCFSSENEDGGVYYAPELSLEIKDGNLHVHYAHGRYGYWEYTFKFQNSDFELIGYFSSNGGAVVDSETSINFLTEMKQKRVNTNENSKGGDEVFKETWQKINTNRLVRLSEIKDFDELDMSVY